MVSNQGSQLHWWLIATAGALAAAALFWFDPGHFHFYPLCLFHTTTGLLCPGCGSLRALHQLLHGHPMTAFHCNPLLLLSLPFVLWYASARMHRKLKGLPTARMVHPAGFWLFLAVALIFGVVRNLPGEPFVWLRP
jgi:hypothetical protein